VETGTSLLSRRSRQWERLSASMLPICSSVCWRPIGSRTWASQRTHYWTPRIQDGWVPPSWTSTWRHYFCRGWSDLDKISQTRAEWHVDCGDIVEIETRCRITIWRTFGRIQWRVIPEPHATLQGLRISSATLKILFRHILFYFFNAVWALTSGGFRIVSDRLVKTRKGKRNIPRHLVLSAVAATCAIGY